MNKPVITLLEISGCSPDVFSQVWDIAKEDTPLGKIKPLSMELLGKHMAADLPTQEYINTIWAIEGMPRAFWDQLDRCRRASFWEQSARVIDLSKFADENRYWIPEQIENNEEAKKEYIYSMYRTQDAYKRLIHEGIPAEEARGVIPLYVLTRGTMCINLRALKGLIRTRLCFVCQGSYWFPIIKGMMDCLAQYLLPETLRSLVSLPCQDSAVCPIAGSVLQRMTGEDPNPVCPLYIQKFCGETAEEVEAEEIKRRPNYPLIKQQYIELIESLGLGGDGVEG